MKPILMIPLLAFFVGCAAMQNSEQASGNRSQDGLLYEAAPDLPRQILIVGFPLGAGSVPKEKQGLTAVLSELLQEGPEGQDSLSFKRKLFLLNAEFSLSADSDSATLVVRAPKETLEESLQLALDTLKNPKTSGNTFDEIKNRVLTNRKVMNEDMRQVIFYFARRDMFDYHPRTLDGTGSPQSMSQVTREDVKSFAEKLHSTKPFSVVTAGPVAEEDIRTILRKRLVSPSEFAELRIEPVALEKFKRKDLKITIINKPGARDHQVLFMNPIAIDEDSPRFVHAEVAHHLLGGGGLSGELFKALREERGLTYGAYSGISGLMSRWVIWTFASSEKLPELLKTLQPVVKGFADEAPASARLSDAQATMISEHRQALELPLDRLLETLKHRKYGLDPRFMQNRPKHIEAVTAKDVQEFATDTMSLDAGYLYLMGDKAELVAILDKLGWKSDERRIIEVPDIP